MERTEAITVLVAVGAQLHKALAPSDQKRKLRDAIDTLTPKHSCANPVKCFANSRCSGE